MDFYGFLVCISFIDQVHLICMPPSNDNACQQSSKYHIVNDFLYKPINVEEHQTRPNVTLRYSERYYPEDIYRDERQEEEEENEQSYRAREYRQRQPVRLLIATQFLLFFGNILLTVMIQCDLDSSWHPEEHPKYNTNISPKYATTVRLSITR